MLEVLLDLDVADEQWQFRISAIGGKSAGNCLSEPGMGNLPYNAGGAGELQSAASDPIGGRSHPKTQPN